MQLPRDKSPNNINSNEVRSCSHDGYNDWLCLSEFKDDEDNDEHELSWLSVYVSEAEGDEEDSDGFPVDEYDDVCEWV